MELLDRPREERAPCGLSFLSGDLKSLVFGGLDGVCTSLSLVWSGVAAGTEEVPTRTLLILGIAGLISQGFAMGLGTYLGATAEEDAKQKFSLSPHKGASLDAQAAAIKSGVVMFISFVGFGSLPLAACLPVVAALTPGGKRFVLFASTILSLFFLGMLRGRMARETPWTSGLAMVATGGGAALISFSAGAVLRWLVDKEVG
eukprot:Sspe_Gene.52182::Locus_28915_Transcript_1_1_Confidence_1.000_Length_1135::g.52182::m.52182